MSANEQRIFIETFLLNSFAAAQPDFQVVVGNIKEPTEPSRYVTYHDMAGEALQGELTGKSFDRAVGVLQIDIMVPENEGTHRLFEVGDYLKEVLSKKSFTLPNNSVLVFRVGSHRYIGVNSQLARQSFRIGYYRDDRRMGSI